MTLPRPLTFLRALGRFLWAFLRRKQLFVRPRVYKQRLNDGCYQCASFNRGQCALCSCVVIVKAWLATEECPVGRWQRNLVDTWIP